MSGVDLEAVRRDYEADMSLRDIALRHGCSKSVVNKWAKRNGWQRRRGPKVDKMQVSTATSTEYAQAGEKAPDFGRVSALALKLLDHVEQTLDYPEPLPVKDLRGIAATLIDVKEILHAVSPAEAEEQQARLQKLRADAENAAREEAGSEIQVRIMGMSEEEIDEVIG